MSKRKAAKHAEPSVDFTETAHCEDVPISGRGGPVRMCMRCRAPIGAEPSTVVDGHFVHDRCIPTEVTIDESRGQSFVLTGVACSTCGTVKTGNRCDVCGHQERDT